MRKFSDLEKDIIREIANLAKSNTTFPVFILFKDLFIDREIFRYDSGPHHLLYNFTKVNQDELRKEERLLFDRLLLIEFYLTIATFIFTWQVHLMVIMGIKLMKKVSSPLACHHRL